VEDIFSMYRKNYWEPSLAIVAEEGIATRDKMSPVLSKSLKTCLNIRLPPLVDPEVAANAVLDVLSKDPPYGAQISAKKLVSAPGWSAEDLIPELADALNKGCQAVFGKAGGASGSGGTIPLMGKLASLFPQSSLVVTGACAPESSLHGPNECINLEFMKKITACIAATIGFLDPPQDSWPEDVPRPVAPRRPQKPRFCFRDPSVPAGFCPCCL